jgi:hypothetical protein
MTFQLSDHGSVFSTRPKGASVRKIALSQYRSGDEIHVSFAGVKSISYSFADEFLGPLMLGPNRVVLDDVPTSLHRIIMSTLQRRGVRAEEREIFGSVPA